MNGEGSTPSCLLSMHFDAIGESMTPPHLFSTQFNVKGEGSTPPCLFQYDLMQTGRAQPLPFCFRPILRHKEGYGMGLTPLHPFLTCFDATRVDLNPLQLFLMCFNMKVQTHVRFWHPPAMVCAPVRHVSYKSPPMRGSCCWRIDGTACLLFPVLPDIQWQWCALL